MVQELLIIEERAYSAGELGIPVATLPQALADSIVRLQKMDLLAVQYREDRIVVTFEPLFAQLVPAEASCSLTQLAQMYEEVQAETRRLDGLRKTQVLERMELDEERKLLRQERAQLTALETELRERYGRERQEADEERRVLREERERLALLDDELRAERHALLADRAALQTEQQAVNEERRNLLALRQELEKIRASLTEVSAGHRDGNAATAMHQAPAGDDDKLRIAAFLQQLRGQAVSDGEIREIQKMQATYRWPLDFVLLFLEEAIGHGCQAVAEYRRQANLVAQRGLVTREQVRTFFQQRSHLDERISEVWATLGSSFKINDVFLDMYTKWSKTWGFAHDVILCACRETYRGAANPNLNYADAILQRWKAAGVRTVEEGEREIERFKLQRSRPRGGRGAGKTPSPNGPLAGTNVVPQTDDEAQAYERFKFI